MSIGPVQGFATAGEMPLAGENLRAARTRPSPDAAVPLLPSDSGSVQKRGVPSAQTSSSQPLSERFEVQVQRDTELQNELIFKYVDRAGNLFLQVPSAQALSVKRGILEQFRQRASDTEAPARQP